MLEKHDTLSRHTTESESRNVVRDLEEKTKSEKNREMKELERATRTVFINNLNIRVTEKDLFILFTHKAGKVLDIYIICDKHTNKSKGLAYVELETIESMARALELSGSELYGQPIQVKPSEMEKNVQWTLQKQAQQGIVNSHLISLPILSNSTPGVDVAAAAAAAAALLSKSGREMVDPSNGPQDDQQNRKIYIGNLPREINELVLRNMFEPFGFVESSNVIKDPTGKSQGYGFILFREKNVVDKAIQAMNGMLIGSNIIKVNYVTSNTGQQVQPEVLSSLMGVDSTKPSLEWSPSTVDLDRVSEDDKFKINAQNRIMLMQKLAASAKITLPCRNLNDKPTIMPHEIVKQDENFIIQSQFPYISSERFKIKNMFDMKEINQENRWECEIKEDVYSELSKIGRVKNVHIDKESPGCVTVEMQTIAEASHAVKKLLGRIYGGKQIEIEPID